MNEGEIRAEHIDPALKAAGCGIFEGTKVRREPPIPLGRLEGAGPRRKLLVADHAMVYRGRTLDALEKSLLQRAFSGHLTGGRVEPELAEIAR